jgi:propanediol dehydratase small subunit
VRIDALADALTRFAPSEICELARSQDVVVRALANEALAQLTTSMLLALAVDPVDAEIAREALRRQAMEFGSDDARQVLFSLQQFDNSDEEL